MRPPRKTSTLLLALVLAACSGTAAAPATTVVETAPPTTRPAPTTTTEESTTTTEESTTTTTTIPPDPVMPLTGMPIEDPSLAGRPAVVVKISNDPGARPQSGVDSADIVFEAWGAGPTRFAAVFQSEDAPKVGPIRSARTQDVDLAGSFNGAVFACSGGNAGAMEAIRSSDLLVLTERQGPGWFLDKNRRRPHATFSDTASLRSNVEFGRPGPAEQLHYREAGEAAEGVASAGLKLKIQSIDVEWQFVPETNSYLRSQEGRPHLMADRTRLDFTNVVVLWINYDHSPADERSPDGGTIGNGDAVVFTNGKMIQAKWARNTRLKPIELTDMKGAPIQLTAGSTWFELANTGLGAFPGTDELEILPA